MDMKYIIMIILIGIFSFTLISYAEEKNNDNNTMMQEEKTDKIVKDFFHNIDKTIKDSTKKIADDIKTLNK